jgi:hypothetical protein
MSDEYYRQRAAQRGRRIIIFLGVALVIICGVVGVVRAFLDSCTESFTRSPQAVIESYIKAINDADQSVVINCWHHDPFYDPETGCSEACLSKFIGTQIEVEAVSFSEPQQTPGGRTRLDVNLITVCKDTGQEYSTEIILDTVSQNYPWRHWHIAHSNLGGSVPKQWCK